MKKRKQKQELILIDRTKELDVIADKINSAKTKWVDVAKGIAEAKDIFIPNDNKYHPLERKLWLNWCKEKCDIEKRMAEMYTELMQVLASNPELEKKDFITVTNFIAEQKKAEREKEIEKLKKKQRSETNEAKKGLQYQLINGDLFEEIKNIERQFDLIYVDPPYNILEEEWDKFSEKEFKEFTIKWLNAILPKLKDDGRLYVSFSQWGMFNFYEWMKEFCEKYDLIFTNMIVWNYRNNVKPHNKKGYKYSYEPLFYFRKKNAKDLNDLPEFGEERQDVWNIATPQSNFIEDKKEHPSQKPKELLKRIILTGCDIDSWILDPFAGVGTTGIVAKETGRNFILIEKDKEYFKIMEKEINDI